MKKIFSFLCLIVAVTAMTSCSSAKEEKGTSGTGNAVLDNIFERKSVRAYLNKGVEKEKIDLMLRAGMAAPTGRDIRPWEFVVVSDRAKLDSMAAALPYAKMLTQARNAIIVCGDSVRSSYWYLDCSAAAQNILLAAKSLGLGWNLGNQLDAHNSGVANETAWGNQKTTQALFDKLAAAGITTVRIPVTWMGHIGDAPGYEIEKAWMDRVAEVVGYAENAGLNAIVNIHHDGADSEYWLSIKDAAQDETKNTAIKTELKAVWTQIAERFKDKGNFLAFESMNEIHDGGWGWGDNRNDGGKQYSILNDWNQVFVDAVRAVGGGNSNRFLGVPGYCTNVALTVSNFKLPTDKVQNRLMVSVHFYDPNEYTLDAKYSEWGHTGAADKKANWGDEDNVKDVFNSLKTTYIDKGIPVYIGEMGCVSRTTDRAESFRKYYLEYVCKAAKEYGLAPVYWDNGGTGSGKEESGLFNHATGDYLNNAAEIVEVMKKAIFTEDTSYTLQSVYDNAPQ